MEKIHEEGIIPNEKGILKRDGIYFHSPSEFAKEHLFCVLWGAEDVCDFPYRVRREYLNAFMFTRILEGSLHYEYRGKTFIAQAGDIVLQDCKLFNHYWSEERVRLQFIHFSGGVTQAYCDMLYEQYGACFHNFSTAGPLFDDLLTELQKSSPNDHQLSFLVTDLFRQLSIPQDRQVNPSVRKAMEYMNSFFCEELTLADVCSHVSLSPYYFSRLFKRHTSQSPHQYLLGLRLKHARMMLAETRESIETIAAACGFASTSHFIRAFKKEAGVTPASFRKLFKSPP